MKYENLNEIASILLDTKIDLIITNAVILCLAIVAIYFHARIKKSAELEEINNNFSQLLAQQQTLTKATEKIKQSINKESISYQIRLNAYHEKSTQAINDIYSAIIQMRDMAKTLGFNHDEAERIKFFQAVTNFHNIFDTQKIWIPNELATNIGKVAKEIDDKATKFVAANRRAENIQGLAQDRVDDIFNTQEKFYDYINEEISVIFEELSQIISNEIRI